jgi:hypothetical protein
MEGDHLKDTGVDGNNIKIDLRENGLTGTIWLRTGKGNGPL